MSPANAHAPSSEEAVGVDAYDPERFGFHRQGTLWIKEFPRIGVVALSALGWQHAHTPSYDRPDGGRTPMDALRLLVQLQRQTWGLPPEDVVPANLLAVLADTGGSVLVAYEAATGFNADGWLGFAIAAGSRDGTLVSHMLGVRDDVRGTGDLGWHLKLVQGYEAVRSGHTAASWTFDPMRGINARLNLEKLGATVELLAIDKYGVLPSSLYGEDVPSDRLTAHWDLLAPATAERLARVAAGAYQSPGRDDIATIPEVTSETVDTVIAERPPRVRYRIPGDIDRLAKRDPGRALRWRQEMRTVLAALLTSKWARPVGDATSDPAAVTVIERPGAYLIDGFATELDDRGERQSCYVLRRVER